jgi:hypothetical protein
MANSSVAYQRNLLPEGLLVMRKETSMKVYQETIAPPDPLPVVSIEPSDVGLFHRTISSLEQENTCDPSIKPT